MHILVVSDLPQFVTGGAEMQTARLIEVWLESGHEVICLGRRMGPAPAALGRHRITVHRIRTSSLIGRWGRAASYMLSLTWLLLRHRRWADVVYTRFLGEPAVTTAFLKLIHLIRAPLIATPAGTGSSGDISFLHSVPFTSRLIRLLDRHCDAINLIAEDMTEELIEAGFSGHNFSRIPNGIPVRGLQERRAASSPTLLAVGRLAPEKGYDILLHALAQICDKLDPGQMRIIGDGPERERLIATAQELRVADRVEFLGELPQERVMSELAVAQLFLLPSRYEGLSNAGLEAMERGLPVILTRCGGLDQYVDQQTGWVVPPGDITALAEAISQALAAGPVSLSRMGARARAVIERNFDMAIIADRYIALFERLSGGTLRHEITTRTMTTSTQIVSVVIPVFQDGERAVCAVHCLRKQILPDATSLEIIVVDDGSNDGTADMVADCVDESVRLLQLAQNQGRSAARNAGAQQSRGKVVVFMDCDCLPVGNSFLAAHLDALRQGHVASTGHVVGTGGGFWERYQRDASSRRERQHAHGHGYSGSSQNLAVLKSTFEQVGGFDIKYRHYGFEDRDLLLRLCESGSVAWAGNASVHHLDALTFPGLSCKMTEAGEFTAGRFATRHPAAYKVLGYAAIDARKQTWLGPVGRRLGPHMADLAQRIDPLLNKPWMPYPLAKTIVKAVSAVSFLYGTTRATR